MNCCQGRSVALFKYFTILSLLLVLTSCSTISIVPVDNSTRTTTTTGMTPAVKEDKFVNERNIVVKAARGQLGKNYKYAGTGPNHWDCSGLTLASYQKANIKLPRTSRAMAKLGKDISVENSQPGDLIFYSKEGRVFHVSVITENAGDKLWVVHSTTSRGVIEEDVLASSYWRKKIYKVISLAALK